MKTETGLIRLTTIMFLTLLSACDSIQTNQVSQQPGLFTECPRVSEVVGSWQRYRPNIYRNVLEIASKSDVNPQNTDNLLYIQTSADRQLPSCVPMEYLDTYRELADPRKTLIQMWSGTFDAATREEIMETLKHEVLLSENGQEYWFSVQEPLIPFMKSELTVNEPVTVFIIWVGSTYIENIADHVFMIGEFSK